MNGRTYGLVKKQVIVEVLQKFAFHFYMIDIAMNTLELAKLLADSPASKNLRSIIIDKIPAEFVPGLGELFSFLAFFFKPTIYCIYTHSTFDMSENTCIKQR